MYEKLLLSTPARFLSLPGMPIDPSPEYLYAREYARDLSTYADKFHIGVVKKEVAALVPSQHGVGVSFSDGTSERFRCVVAAPGTSDHPYIPDIPGLRLVLGSHRAFHSQFWPGPQYFLQDKVLIVGAGMRGVEIAEECAKSGLHVTVSPRAGRVRPWTRNFLGRDSRYLSLPALRYVPSWITKWNCTPRWIYSATDGGFKQFVDQGKISIVDEVERIDGRKICLRGGRSCEADVIVLATGYQNEIPFLPPTSTGNQARSISSGMVSGFPHVYFLGLPCAVRADSHFVVGMKHDAPQIARKVLRDLNSL